MMRDSSATDYRIAELIRFGLTPLEAKVYISLIQTGTASAYRVAKNARIHRVEAYRALGRLKKLRLVEEFMGRPALYRPVPPDRGVGLLIDEVAAKLRELNKAREETVRWLGSISAPGHEIEEKPHYRLVEGTKSLRETTHGLWSNAEEEVFFTRDSAHIRVAVKEELALARSLSSRGVMLRGVTDVREENLQDVSSIEGTVELRHLSPMNLHMDVVDSSEALFGAVPDRGEEPTCIWTDSQRYVAVLRELFEHLWEEALPVMLRITELQSGGFPICQEYESLKKDLRNVLLAETTDALKFFREQLERLQESKR